MIHFLWLRCIVGFSNLFFYIVCKDTCCAVLLYIHLIVIIVIAKVFKSI